MQEQTVDRSADLGGVDYRPPQGPSSPPNVAEAREQPAIVEQPIPSEVSAAWELELIIAGAVTFALFQLPGSLDVLRDRFLARADGLEVPGIIIGYLYARVVVFVLIGSFLLNLAARAYWVGLVGLHSVFPKGPRWSELGTGPVFTEVYRSRIPSLPSVIARVDNFASIIFSFAFFVVVAFLFSLTVIGTTSAALYGIGSALFDSVSFGSVGLVVAITYLVPMLLAGLIDKRWGARFAPEGPAHRRLRTAARWVTRLNGSALVGAIMFTLYSNVGRKRMAVLTQFVLLGGFAVATAGLFADMGMLRGGAPAYVPDDPRVRGVLAGNYESLRAADDWTPVPTIQSEVIEGPFVRLFVPYDADRMDVAVPRDCPGVQPLRSRRFHLQPRSASGDSLGPSADRVLECLGRLYAVAIDGAPIAGVRLRFHVHPATGRPGVLAFLPTAGLSSGMHLLTVSRPPLSTAKAPPRPTEIAFWR